eukprot:690514-Pelagomonas_calceolata.AAC.1
MGGRRVQAHWRMANDLPGPLGLFFDNFRQDNSLALAKPVSHLVRPDLACWLGNLLMLCVARPSVHSYFRDKQRGEARNLRSKTSGVLGSFDDIPQAFWLEVLIC